MGSARGSFVRSSLRVSLAALLVVAHAAQAAHAVAQPPNYQPQPQPVPQQAYAPPPHGSYPPQPGTYQPGQVYVVQQGDPAQVAALQNRLLQLQMMRSQHRVGGPIAMIAVGGAIFAIAGLVALSFGAARAADADDIGPGGTDLRRGVRVSSFLALGGVVMVVIGGVRLSSRLRARRQYNPEIQQIRQQLRMYQPTYALRVGPNEVGMQLRMNF